MANDPNTHITCILRLLGHRRGPGHSIMKPVHMACMAEHGVFPGIGDDKQILDTIKYLHRVVYSLHRAQFPTMGTETVTMLRDMNLTRGNIDFVKTLGYTDYKRKLPEILARCERFCQNIM